MKTHIVSLALLLLSGVLSAPAESLIVTNGETLEIGGSKSYETVLISNGTIYLTNNTVITSAGDIQILSGATITWHYTTTNWTTNTSKAKNGSGGSGQSVYAQHGANAWNLTLHSTSNLSAHGTIDLHGGAGQKHVGGAAQGYYGGPFYVEGDRVNHKGGKGGSSCGGNGGNGASLTLFSNQGSIDLNDAHLNLMGGPGGNSGQAGYGGEGGVAPDLYCPGADGGDGGDTYGGNGGKGGILIVQTKSLNINNWNCALEGGLGGTAASTDYNRGTPGIGNGGSYEKPMPNPGNTGEDGLMTHGIAGGNGLMDVIKQAEAHPQVENGQLSLGLDMTSTSATYTVECCTNLFTADWQPAGAFSGRGGSTNWTSALSNGFDKAFYRIQTTY